MVVVRMKFSVQSLFVTLETAKPVGSEVIVEPTLSSFVDDWVREGPSVVLAALPVLSVLSPVVVAESPVLCVGAVVDPLELELSTVLVPELLVVPEGEARGVVLPGTELLLETELLSEASDVDFEDVVESVVVLSELFSVVESWAEVLEVGLFVGEVGEARGVVLPGTELLPEDFDVGFVIVEPVVALSEPLSVLDP